MVLLRKDPETKQFKYSAVIPVEGVSARELYRRANYWAARSLKTTNNSSILSDTVSKTIIANGVFVMKEEKGVRVIKDGLLSFKISLSMKDGRYKYEIYNMILTGIKYDSPYYGGAAFPFTYPFEDLETNRIPKKQIEVLYFDANEGFKALIDSLEKAMKAALTEKEDW